MQKGNKVDVFLRHFQLMGDGGTLGVGGWVALERSPGDFAEF